MTIQQYASFDVEAAGLNATSKTNPALAKMLAAWESKNAKRAMQGTGFTLMAVSLAACGGSDDITADLSQFTQANIDTAVAAANSAAAEAVLVAQTASELAISNAVIAADLLKDADALVLALQNEQDVLEAQALSDLAVANAVTAANETSSTTASNLATVTENATATALEAASTASDLAVSNAVTLANETSSTTASNLATVTESATATALGVANTALEEALAAASLAASNATSAALLVADSATEVAAELAAAAQVTAISNAFRDAAANAGVAGTSTMTLAELTQAIKTANDAGVLAGADLTTNDDAAISAAVVALGLPGIVDLAGFSAAYNTLKNPVATDDSIALTISPDVSAAYDLGAGADTFSGSIVGNLAAGTTLGASDNLRGGEGADNLIIAISGTSSVGPNTVASVVTSSVETIDITNFDTANFLMTINGQQFTGVTHVNLNASSVNGDTQITNLAGVVEATMLNGSGDLTLDYQAASVTGADDQILNVNGTAAGTFTTDNDVEEITVNATGAASILTLVAGSANFTTLDIDATANFSITGALAGTVATIDASDSAGNVSVVPANAAIIHTITMGGGNDVVNMGNNFVAGLTGNDVLVGGLGNDTVIITDNSDLAANSNITGFEVLRLSENAGTAAVNQIAGITTVEYLPAGAANVSANGITEGAAMSIIGNATVLTHTVTGAAIAGTANTLNVTLDLLGVTGATTDVDITAGITAAGIEVMNITSSGVTSPAVAGTTSTNSISTLANSSALTTITIDGASDFLLTTTGNLTALTSIDATSATGRTFVSNASTSSTATTINGGSNVDTLTGRALVDIISGNAGNDIIDGNNGNDFLHGGAGDDTITGGTGNDTITGGENNDTIDSEGGNDNVTGGAGNDIIINSVAAFATNITAADTIAGGLGTDTLRFTHASDVNLVTNSANVANISGIETLQLNAPGFDQTLTLNDLALSINDGSTITVNANSNRAHEINASGVLNNTATVNLTAADAVAGTTITYTVGNAIENLVFNLADGEVSVGNSAFLGATDIVTGGSALGDRIQYQSDLTTTLDTTAVSHSMLGVTGVETLSINTTDATATADYVLTLGDTFVAANARTDNNTFTVVRDNGDTGDTDVDGSAVTSAYLLSITGGTAIDDITGGAGNDTLIGGPGADNIVGGAGNDEITGGTGADALTGGLGSDDFNAATPGANGLDTISDFNWGTTVTGSTTVDQLDLSLQLGIAALPDVDLLSTGAVDGNTEVFILDDAAYASSATAEDAVVGHATATGEGIVIWQDTLGGVHLSRDAAMQTDATGFTEDLFIFSGVSLGDIKTLIDTGDFIA